VALAVLGLWDWRRAACDAASVEDGVEA